MSKLIGKEQLHCPGIGRNADDWVVVLLPALYGESAFVYTGKTSLRIYRPSLLKPAIFTLR